MLKPKYNCISRSKLVFTLILIAATFFTLMFSFKIKEPCTRQAWGAPEFMQYRNLCYNDLEPLYTGRGLDTHAFPYVVQKNYEYPVLMGLMMWVPSLFVKNAAQFFMVSAGLLATLAFISLAALIKALGPRRSILWFAAGTPLLFYAFLNWDLLATCFLCLAMLAWKRGKPFWVGTALGLGISAKIYPIFFLPPLVLALWHDPSRSQKLRLKNILYLGAGVVGTWSLINLPFIIAEWWISGDIQGWLLSYKFQMLRLADQGTLWYLLKYYVGVDVPAFSSMLPSLIFGVMSFWLMGVKLKNPERRWPLVIISASLAVIFFICIHALTIRKPAEWNEYAAFINHASLSLLVVGALALMTNQWFRNKGAWCTGGAILALNLILSKTSSPQYTLWIIPVLIAVKVRPVLIIGYLVGDLATFVGTFYWFATASNEEFNFWRGVIVSGVILKDIFLGLFILHCGFEGKDRLRFGGWSTRGRELIGEFGDYQWNQMMKRLTRPFLRNRKANDMKI